MKRGTKIALTSAGILVSLISLSGCVDNMADFMNSKLMYGPAPAFEFDNGLREEATRIASEETTNNG